MMSGHGGTVANRDGQMKFAQTRVATVEKYYGLLCDTLGSVIRKSARLRNKGDLFAQHVKEYAEAEKLNNSTRVSLTSFAQNFSTVQDYRNAEVLRLEKKVLAPLTKYGDECKKMKENVKKNTSAWQREKKQLEKIGKLQQKGPPSSPQIIEAEAVLQEIRKESGAFGEQLIAKLDLFEREKLADLKSVLSEFVQIEMMFHARALKYLSKCYEAAQRIDTDADMDQFRAALLEASGLARSFTQTATTFSNTGHSSSLGGGTLSSSEHYSHPSMYQQSPRVRIQGPMYDDDDDDDSDEYDDDDEDYES